MFAHVGLEPSASEGLVASYQSRCCSDTCALKDGFLLLPTCFFFFFVSSPFGLLHMPSLPLTKPGRRSIRAGESGVKKSGKSAARHATLVGHCMSTPPLILFSTLQLSCFACLFRLVFPPLRSAVMVRHLFYSRRGKGRASDERRESLFVSALFSLLR